MGEGGRREEERGHLGACSEGQRVLVRVRGQADQASTPNRAWACRSLLPVCAECLGVIEHLACCVRVRLCACACALARRPTVAGVWMSI